MEDWEVVVEKRPIEVQAVESLGLGFDLTSDFRLKFAKKERLVVLDESHRRDLVIPAAGAGPAVSIPGVSADVRCDKGEQMRFKSDVLQFNQVYPFLNSIF